MKRLRELILGHRVVAATVAAAALALAGWELYAVVGQSGPAPASSVTRHPDAVAPAAPDQSGTTAGAAAGPSGSAALRAAGHLAGVPAPTLPGAPSGASAAAGTASAGGAPAGGQTSATQPATTSGAGQPASGSSAAPATGRPDPFSPLATTGAGGPVNPPLPPVPPLAPGALPPGAGASAFLPPGTPGPATFHLMGIISGPSALAILADGGGSYIVQPGDTVRPGVRITAIDTANRTVTLASTGQSWQVPLQVPLGGGTGR